MDKKQRTFRQRMRARVMSNMPVLVVLSLSLLFCVVYFSNRIIISVQAGEAGVLWKRFFGGTVVDRPYGEGLHLIWPWDKMHVYNVRNQAIPHSFEVLTKKGLPIVVHLTIRYRPELDLIGVLHQEVGPRYVDVIVKPEVEAVIRSVIGRYDVAEVYTTKRSLVEKIVNEALEQTSQRYVEVDDVLLTQVTLPVKVREAIEMKLVEEQKYEAFEYILKSETEEAKRKRIEAAGIRDFQKTIAESLSKEVLTAKGIRATEELAKSKNSKVVVIGAGDEGLPLILGNGK